MVWEWNLACEERALSQKNYPTGEDPQHVYCSMLCAADMPDGFDATFQCYEECMQTYSRARAVRNFKPFNIRNTRYHRYAMGLVELFRNRIKMIKFAELAKRLRGRKLARTGKGYLALVSADAVVGDVVMLCKGSKLHLVVRRMDMKWQLVESCYVHGIMYGEAWDESQCTDTHII